MNSLKRNPQLKLGFLKRTAKSLTDQFLFALLKNKIKHLKPFFIVGCGHSGTSIMLSILNSHSQIHGVPSESEVFLGRKLAIIFQALKWQQECLVRDKQFWIEKTPKHIYVLQQIFDCFPYAKVIVMMRDGRDVACSIKARTGSFEHGMSRWKRSNVALSNFIHDNRVKIVKLEELVKDPESTLREVTSFLGLHFEEAMLDHHKTEKYYYSDSISKPDSASGVENHLALRNWQINQPLFKDTCRWPKEMGEDEKEAFKLEAQEDLERFGYETSLSW